MLQLSGFTRTPDLSQGHVLTSSYQQASKKKFGIFVSAAVIYGIVVCSWYSMSYTCLIRQLLRNNDDAWMFII